MTPKAYHKHFIDNFVKLTPSIGHRLLSEEGIYSKAPAYRWINEIIRDMSPEQIEAIQAIVAHEREAALHDALVFINDEICANETQIVHQGQPMYIDEDGLTLYQEYVGRIAGDGWDDIFKD